MNSKELLEKLYLLDEIEKKQFTKKDMRKIRDLFFLKQEDYKGRKEYCFSQSSEDPIEISKQPRMTYIPPHFHTYIELNYVYSGRMVTTIGDQEITVLPGEILLLDQNVLHEVHILNENDIAVSFILNKKFLSSDLIGRIEGGSILTEFMLRAKSKHSRMENYVLFHIAEEQEKIRGLMDIMLCEFYDFRSNSEDIIQSSMIVLLQYLSRIREFSTNMQYRDTVRKSMLDLEELLDYIADNYQDCDLKMLETHFRFNPNYISSYLKKMTGMSFKELLLREKMKHAKVLLDETALPVVRIIEIVGFSNPTFFYRKFEEYYKIPLSKYSRNQ